MYSISSYQPGENTCPQSHVFASLFSFSEEAQEELLCKLRANILADETQCEWLDSKRLNIVSNDDATVAALFDRYSDYITTEKEGAREVYEVSKLERPIGTIVTTSKEDEAVGEEPFQQTGGSEGTNTSLEALVTHEVVSKAWNLDIEVTSKLPKRLLKPSIFQGIGAQTNCQISLGPETGMLTVKGDNDREMDGALEYLGNLARAFALRSNSPLVHEFVIVEAELDVSFQIRALDEKETKDQLSTTIIGPKRFQTSKPGYFGVVLMVKKGRAVITRSRTEAANGTITTLPDKNCWQGVQILRHGNQAINFASLDGRNTNTPSHPESLELPLPLPNQILANAATTPGPTSKFVEEWVQTTAETKCIQPFEPIKEPFKGEPLVEPLVESDSEEAVKGKDARASPMKRRHARNRKKPSAQDDAAIEDEDDASVAHLIEPRFTSSEEARSSRPTSYAHSVLHDSDSARATPQLIEIGVEETCQQANNCMVQRAVMSINPNCELLSICDSHRSKPPDSRSATDRPRKPAVVGDLLTQEDSRVAYPVVFPAPAINAPYMPSTSSRASYASELPAGSSVPGWLNRNPTTTASTTRRKGLLLIDDEEAEPAAQPASYLAAAKRGAGRSRGQPPGRGIAHRRAYRGVDPPKEGLQPNSEVQSRKVHHTMNQKMAKPDIRQASQLEAFERATVQLLQSANTFRGKVKLEVDIGRILVKAGNGTIGRTFLSSDWSSIFSDRTGNRPETVFTHLLPASDLDIRYMAGLKQSYGRHMFAESPYESGVRYQFLCGTKSEDEDVILEVDGSGSVQVLSTEHLVGAVNWHFPKRQWDARLAVKIIEEIGDYQECVNAVDRTLSIVPSSDGRTAKLYAELGNTNLFFKSASTFRDMKFHCLVHPDIVMSCTEVQELGPAKARRRYWNSLRDVEVARNSGDLWWEIKLQSLEADKKLQTSRSLPLGKEADLKAEDIVREGAVKQLHEIASDIVTQIDGIGASINMAAKAASLAHQNQAKAEAAKEVDTFW